MSLANFLTLFKAVLTQQALILSRIYTFIDICIFEGLNEKLIIQKLQNVQSIGSYGFSELLYVQQDFCLIFSPKNIP